MINFRLTLKFLHHPANASENSRQPRGFSKIGSSQHGPGTP